MAIQSKLPHVGTSIFAKMSALAAQHQAVNLSQGFPDFPCDPKLLALVTEAMQNGQNQYAPFIGLLPLREQISQKVAASYQVNYSPETEITITSGGTEALFCAISALVRMGDEIIIFEPAYDSYAPVIALCGGVVKRIALKYPHYKVDWDEVKRLISPRTKAIILNTPHNPCGTVWSRNDMLALSALVQQNNLTVISDEVYEHLIFDNVRHESVLRYPELRERSFVVFSFGKTFHATGWKVGYCLAPKALSGEFRKVHQFVTFSTSTPFQVAIAKYLENPAHYEILPDFYQQKRDYFLKSLHQTPFQFKPSAGTYFQLAYYGHLSDEPDVAFAERLTRDYGVAVIPVSAFYSDGTDEKVIRFCFAKREETLDLAAQRLELLAKLLV